jgi:hypothetical protein
MNSYIMIRRLRGPAFLLLVGVLALLNQADIISWGRSWPFFLILAGVLQLAERAILAAGGGYPQAPYPGQPYQATPDFRAAANIPAYPGQPESFVPPPQPLDPDQGDEGGRR